MMLVRKAINRGLRESCFVLLLLGALVRPAWAQQSFGESFGRVFGSYNDEHQFMGSGGFGLLQKTWP